MLLWVICMLPLIHSEVHTSALLTFCIYYYLSHRQHRWRVNNQYFQCFGDLNPNQRTLEQVRRPGWWSTYSFHKIGNKIWTFQTMKFSCMPGPESPRITGWGLMPTTNPNLFFITRQFQTHIIKYRINRIILLNVVFSISPNHGSSDLLNSKSQSRALDIHYLNRFGLLRVLITARLEEAE